MTRDLIGQIACSAAAVVASFALTSAATAAGAAAGPVVRTQPGLVSGRDQGAYSEFLGLPFAAPPRGDLRWKPPAPPPPWSGVRPALSFSAKCVQPPTSGEPVEGAEDCLYLNVYAPGRPSAWLKMRRPVLVWFHPGSLTSGSGQDVDGHSFAVANDELVVTVNYRLGVFGFASLRGLDEEDPRGVSGNYGFLDQQAALRWVRDNIAAFGGDPSKVTIAGQSAGSFSSFVQIVSPGAAGLFRGAITMSSPIVVSSAYNYPGNQTTQNEQREGPSSHLAHDAGCGQAADSLACLRGKSVEEIAQALRPWGPNIPWGVRVDGVVLPNTASRLVASGRYNHVPILNGSTDRETAAGPMRNARPMSEKQYRDAVLAQPHGLRSIEVFAPAPGLSYDELMVQESTSVFACNVLRTGNAFSKATPVYEYLFADPAPPVNGASNAFGFKPGAYHTSDIQYVFGQRYPNSAFPGAPSFTPAQAELSRRMMADWGQFVREGRITSPGWGPLAESGSVGILKPDSTVVQAPQRALRDQFKCDYWDTTHAIP